MLPRPMRAFSTDLRQRVLDAALRGDATERAVAHRFGVSLALVQKLKRRWRTAGTAEPVPQRRGPDPALSDDDRAALAERVRAVPDATDDEHRAWLEATRGVSVSRSTVNRALGRLGLSLKKRRSERMSATGRM